MGGDGVMLIFLWLFVPGVIGSAFHCGLKKRPLLSVDFFVYLFIYAFLINLFVLGVALLRGHGLAPWNTLYISIGNMAKYGGLALTAAVAFPNIFLLFGLLRREKRHE
jgi:hypothetical protein